MAKKTPFKAAPEFEKELTTFANIYKTIIHDHSDKISDYFEIACYNMIIKYYEQCGYKKVESLSTNVAPMDIWKTSPTFVL